MRIFILGLMLLLMGCQTVATPSSTPTRTSERTATPQIGVQFATLAPPTMAIVQITPSPLPTATATPTPTPVVYAVQGGDTLWSIALKNQTLPETIEALNVGLRPEALQIGQEIVLPPRPTALAADNVGTPIPVEIVVNSVQFYRTPTGGGWVLGEIENRGAFSAENIQLKIGLVDDQSQALGDVFAWSSAPLLPPNAKAPFAAQIPALAVDPASVSAS
ncbi:MAG: LysM peptidoglycan-binding domain-containing protein, partial [Candidatus Promineifilaceae bacterium]